MVEMLAASGDMVGDPRPITHPVKFYERGDRPLEIVTSRQWFIRNGGRDETLRRELLAAGQAARLAPAVHEGPLRRLGQRPQRRLAGRAVSASSGFPSRSGTPSTPRGSRTTARPSCPRRPSLPIDPTTDVPPGYEAAQRGVPGGFAGDPDVMDTWATSSVTPQIACGWEDDPDLFAATFPMDLRPQGPRSSAPGSSPRCCARTSSITPCRGRHATINGWILDPDRKKMSKSKGNVVTPMAMLEEFGSDAVRYWACNGRPGTDTALDTGVMKIGRRLAIKILNASKFALGRLGEGPVPGIEAVREPLDAALLTQLAALVEAATAAHEGFDYARALEITETFFWSFCDDYLELVKTRAYGEGDPVGADSARATLAMALSVAAPPLRTVPALRHRRGMELVAGGIGAPGALARPHGHRGRRGWRRGGADGGGRSVGAVRREKTAHKRSMRARVALLTVSGPEATLAAVEAARGDLVDAGGVDELVLAPGDALSVEVALADEA